MARIRSIKPEFFTSKTMANLPWRTRLTFVGLWTHCDDAGRCVDDATLIRAALFVRDDDVTDADVESDLHELEMAGLITRYSGHYRGKDRPLLAIDSWSEHQQISRPTKSRIPAPDAADDVSPPADDMNPHVNDMSPHAIPATGAVELGEQGSRGTEEQGNGAPDGDAAQRITREYVEKVPLSKFPAIQTIVKRAMKAGYTEPAISAALDRLAISGRSVTVDALRIELEGVSQPPRLSSVRASIAALTDEDIA
jgi:hypothetical protein